jgi:predicted DNA-binding transcriptional regulator
MRMIKSRRTRLARHVALMRQNINVYKVLVRKRGGMRPLAISRRERRITLKRILNKWYGRLHTEFICLSGRLLKTL